MSGAKSRFQRWAKRKAEAKGSAPVATEAKHGGALPGVMITDPTLLPSLQPEDETKDSPEAKSDEQVALAVEADVQAAPKPGDAEGEVKPEDLPDIETLTEESDFTPFMKEGVPEELRKLALRKLWRSNPIFANLDGMNEYDEDYNVIDKLISLADTGYKPGKGFMTEEDWAQYEDDEDDVGDGDDEGFEERVLAADPPANAAESAPDETPKPAEGQSNAAETSDIDGEAADDAVIKNREAAEKAT